MEKEFPKRSRKIVFNKSYYPDDLLDCKEVVAPTNYDEIVATIYDEETTKTKEGQTIVSTYIQYAVKEKKEMKKSKINIEEDEIWLDEHLSEICLEDLEDFEDFEPNLQSFGWGQTHYWREVRG